MNEPKLFEDLPEQAGPARALGGPRLREPERDQHAVHVMCIDSLVDDEHPVRAIWAYVERLDLRELEDKIKSRAGTPGHPSIAPRLMLALWLYATSDGVGSARLLERLCNSHDAYRWLCGGVGVNHHTLSTFRTAEVGLLDRLLTDNVTALVEAGIISLDKLVLDGVRVRASAGASSFRSGTRLEELRSTAEEAVRHLREEVDSDPDAGNRRRAAARERAARERLERVEAASAAQAELVRLRAEAEESTKKTDDVPPKEAEDGTAKPEAKDKDKKKEPRASTTDVEARVMKMADGGFRPAYNAQVVSPEGSTFVVMVDPCTSSADRCQLQPMIGKVQAAYGVKIDSLMADSGYTRAKDIETAFEQDISLYCPPIKNKHHTDPYKVRKYDGPGAKEWRGRMGSAEGQERYKRRSICECIHARWRQWRLYQFTVRGIRKVKAVLLWYALATNILQAHRLMKA